MPDANATVAELVADSPRRARVFEQLGIDYCCGGKQPLKVACERKHLDPATVLQLLDDNDRLDDSSPVDAGAMSMTELCDHIEQIHHGYLRTELPRLDRLTEKVATVHGEHEPRLLEIRQTFLAFNDELSQHMLKEERILFPLIRQLAAATPAPAFHCGSIANPIGQMEHEHDVAGAALAAFRSLSDDYTAPDWACNTYRAMLEALHTLELDLHQHIHKENNVLFPRAIACEAAGN